MNLSPEDRAAARALFSYPIEFALPGEQAAKPPVPAPATPVAAPLTKQPHEWAKEAHDAITSSKGDASVALAGGVSHKALTKWLRDSVGRNPAYAQTADLIDSHVKNTEAAAKSAKSAESQARIAAQAASAPVPEIQPHAHEYHGNRKNAIKEWTNSKNPDVQAFHAQNGTLNPDSTGKTGAFAKRVAAHYDLFHAQRLAPQAAASPAAAPAPPASPPAALPDAKNDSSPSQAAVLPATQPVTVAPPAASDRQPAPPVAAGTPDEHGGVVLPNGDIEYPNGNTTDWKKVKRDKAAEGRRASGRRIAPYEPPRNAAEAEAGDRMRASMNGPSPQELASEAPHLVPVGEKIRYANPEPRVKANTAKPKEAPIGKYTPLPTPDHLRRFAGHEESEEYLNRHGVHEPGTAEERQARLLDAYMDFYGKPLMQPKAQPRQQSNQRGLVQPTFGNVMNALMNRGANPSQPGARQSRKLVGQYTGPGSKVEQSNERVAPASLASSEADRVNEEFGSGNVSGSMNGATGQGYTDALKAGSPPRKQPGFKYEAMDNTGLESNGYIYADHEDHARDQLRDQGLFATKITQHGGRNTAQPAPAGDQSTQPAPIGPHVAKGMFNEAARKSAVSAFLNHPDSKEYLEKAGAMQEGIPNEEVWRRIDKAYSEYHQSNPQSAAKPTTRERFMGMVGALKDGTIKQHLANGIEKGVYHTAEGLGQAVAHPLKTVAKLWNRAVNGKGAAGDAAAETAPADMAEQDSVAQSADSAGAAPEMAEPREAGTPASRARANDLARSVVSGRKVDANNAERVAKFLDKHGYSGAADKVWMQIVGREASVAPQPENQASNPERSLEWTHARNLSKHIKSGLEVKPENAPAIMSLLKKHGFSEEADKVRAQVANHSLPVAATQPVAQPGQPKAEKSQSEAPEAAQAKKWSDAVFAGWAVPREDFSSVLRALKSAGHMDAYNSLVNGKASAKAGAMHFVGKSRQYNPSQAADQGGTPLSDYDRMRKSQYDEMAEKIRSGVTDPGELGTSPDMVATTAHWLRGHGHGDAADKYMKGNRLNRLKTAVGLNGPKKAKPWVLGASDQPKAEESRSEAPEAAHYKGWKEENAQYYSEMADRIRSGVTDPSKIEADEQEWAGMPVLWTAKQLRRQGHADAADKLLRANKLSRIKENVERGRDWLMGRKAQFSRAESSAIEFLLAMQFSDGAMRQQSFPGMGEEPVAKPTARPEAKPLQYVQKQVLAHHIRSLAHEDRDPRNQKLGRGFLNADRLRGVQLSQYEDPSDDHFREMASILSRHMNQVDPKHHKHIEAVASQYDGPNIQPTTGSHERDVINSVGQRAVRLTGVQKRHRAAVESLKQSGAKVNLYDDYLHIDHKGADQEALAQGLAHLRSQGVHSFSREELDAMAVVLEFTRVKPSKNQMSMFDEESHPREGDEHAPDRRKGEFAKKSAHASPSPTTMAHPPEAPAPAQVDASAGDVGDLLVKSSGLIAHIGRKFGYRDSDLDDFIADVQTRVWKHRDSFDATKAKFSTWLHVIATNVAHSKHQKSSRRNARAKTVSIDAEGDDGSTMAANLKDTHRQSIKLSDEQHQHIHRALMTLPASERDAFVGVHVNGQSASDYADERGISRQAVSGYLKKATETMRKRLLATNQFSRVKPSKGQGGFSFESEADTKGGYADQPVAPVKSQKSFGWDESKVVRVKSAHDQYKPGEFAPKNESQDAAEATVEDAAEATVEEKPQPQQTKQRGVPITLENYGQKNRWYALATLPDGTDVTRSDPDPKEARRMAEEAIRERGHEPQMEGDSTPSEMTTDELVDHLAKQDAPVEAPAKVEPKPASNATWLEGEARAKHIASLVAKMEAKGFKGASVTDVTPDGYGPSGGVHAPPVESKSPVASEAPIKAPAVDQPGYEGASDKGEAESLPQDEQNATVSRLADFGEKLAGARKDQKWTGVGEGASGKKKSDQPAWRKGYSVNVTKDGKYAVIHDGTGGGRQRQIATFDTPEQAEAMIPMAEVARAHSVKNYGTDDAPNYGIYRNITHRKQPVLKDGFASKDEAMKYMAFNAKSLIETKTALTDSIHPRLEEIVRKGKTHRLGGKDADVSDFQKFGFRGVTFGNWNNSPERQHILNHAYDSLTDMADILGVPAKSLSLDGDLGLGFGSHGKGLTGARAHYNRKGVVINLTKMHGAGSLAHEWMHAIDHWVGRLNGKASSDWTAGEDGAATVKTGGSAEEDYASSGLRAYGSKKEFRKEVAEAMTQVMSAIKTRPMKYKEDASSHEKYHTQNLEKIQRKLDEFRRQMAFDYSKTTGYQHYKGKRGLPASDEVLKQVDELSAKILAGDGGEMVRHGQSSADTPANSRSLKWGHSMAANVATLSDLHKALRGNKGYSATDGKLSGLVAEIEAARTSHATSKGRLADAAEQKEKTKSVRSEFMSEAEKMDRGTKADYWAKDHELAARAFESYIYDKIKGNKGRDDFLAYEKHNDLPEYKMFGVKPYPEASGDERKSINAAFDNLFGVLSSHELSGSREATKRPEVRALRKDDGTWQGHWGAKGATEAQLDSLKLRIGSREGVVHINKKGSSATFYTVNANWPIDKLHAHISEKPGKAFKVTSDGTTSFSRELFAALRTLLPGVEFARNEIGVPAAPASVMPQPAPAVAATPVPTKKPRQSRVKLPDISPPQVHYTHAPEFKAWHHGSQVVNEDGTPKMVYHGARRADRISGSGKFDPKRATSGPMAFFTDDPEIAKGYATGKQDTSMEMPDSYSQHFKLPIQGYRKPVDIDRAWHAMPHEQRAKIAALAPRISTDDETGENFEVRPEGHLSGNGGYDHAIRQHRGNALKALVDSWLDSGSLYGQEHRFLDVLKHAGVEGAQHHDPHAEYPAIFPMHLSIKNPLHTTAIPDEVHAALAQAAKRQRGKQGSGADQWDKRHVSGRDFMSRLVDDRANNTTHAWTSIPDWVTQTLQQHGYDGIRDNGGKYNQREHSVWIPFQPHQVKSPFNKKFDQANQKFNFSRDLATAHEFLFGLKVAVS